MTTIAGYLFGCVWTAAVVQLVAILFGSRSPEPFAWTFGAMAALGALVGIGSLFSGNAPQQSEGETAEQREKRLARIADYENSAARARHVANRPDLQGLPNTVNMLKECEADARYWQEKADALKQGVEVEYRSLYQELYAKKEG